jgi:diguanylate cyclase (GGDEF)-like protein
VLSVSADVPDELNFVSEDLVDTVQSAANSTRSWRVLLVDDDEDVRLTTMHVLKGAIILGRPLHFLEAGSAAEARALLREERDIAVALIDVVMESDDAGLRLVKFIREEVGLLDTRIVLRTGQPGYAPEQEVIRDYDINDYKTKSELTSGKLYATLTAALRSYDQLCTINANRRGLETIVRASAELMTVLDMGAFAASVIQHIGHLLDQPVEGIVACRESDATEIFHILVTTDAFAAFAGLTLDTFDDTSTRNTIEEVIRSQHNRYTNGSVTLFVRSSLGRDMVVHLRMPAALDDYEHQLLNVFSTNITVCLDNVALVGRLHEQAFFDSLSRLPNRISFVEKIKEAFGTERATQLTLAVVDIDHFAEANDAFGQTYGDRLLRAIAIRLSGAVGPDVVLARIAGDTFGILGPDDVVNPAFLRDIFRTDFVVDGNQHAVSATFGLARLSEVDSVNYAMQDASIALKRAKLEQRGHYCYYTREMGGEVRARVHLMQDLRKALGAGSLFLMFQPQVNLASGKVVGAETLLRWRTESGQLVPPDQFIPLAEDSGLIVAIGDWVLRSACEQAVALEREGFTDFRMAINVSVVQFRHPDFIAMLERAIAETGVKPINVELEITESVAMLDPEHIVKLLHRIKTYGFTVAIDDFGTGFSSLAYLQRLPVDRLKIDRGFVSRLEYDGEGKNIAEMIIDLGRNLGMDVIAEGIEDTAQADYLRKLGCHEGQGYLYARPLDETALREWLRAHPAWET